ncbi:hypothetical protein GCM10010399_16820 [Dactylosporangium fulvum]
MAKEAGRVPQLRAPVGRPGYYAEDGAGLHDRSPAKIERRVVAAHRRWRWRCGPAGLARRTDVPAAIRGRILRTPTGRPRLAGRAAAWVPAGCGS